MIQYSTTLTHITLKKWKTRVSTYVFILYMYIFTQHFHSKQHHWHLHDPRLYLKHHCTNTAIFLSRITSTSWFKKIKKKKLHINQNLSWHNRHTNSSIRYLKYSMLTKCMYVCFLIFYKKIFSFDSLDDLHFFINLFCIFDFNVFVLFT